MSNKQKIQKLQQQKDRLIEKLKSLKNTKKIKLQKAVIKNIDSEILTLKKL